MNYTDFLALERSKLANERTFLAYFRTFVVLISSAIGIIKLEFLREIETLGFALLFIAPLMLIVGVFRFFYVKNKMTNFFQA